MPIGIGGVSFQGPYSRHEILSRRPGVFAVLDGRSLPPLHAEKTDDVRQTVEEHAGWSDWQERCDNPTFAVFYTSVDHNQRRVERAVREEFDLYEDGGANGRHESREDGEPDAAEHRQRPAATSGGESVRKRRDVRDREDTGGASHGGHGTGLFRFHVPSDSAARRRVRVS